LVVPSNVGNDGAGFGVAGVQRRNPEFVRQKRVKLFNIEIDLAENAFVFL
jgi:hypothetical protein